MASWRQLTPGQTAQVCVYDVITGERRVVLETDELLVEAPNWRAEPDELVVNGDGRLWRVPLAAPALQAVPGEVSDANNDHVLHPDGRRVLVSTAAGELVALDLESGEAEQLTRSQEDGLHYFLHGITPDGTIATFVAKDPQTGGYEVFARDLAAGRNRRLTTTGRHHDGAEPTPDGERIVFNSEREASRPGHSQLYSMALDGSDVQRLTDDDRVNWFPHPSPDGQHLVYLSYEPGVEGHPADKRVQLKLWSDDGEHRVLHELNGGQGTINVPSWAGDSRRFAFVEYPTA